MYSPTIDTLCGPAPLARVYVDNADIIESGGCLTLSSTNWATGSAEYKGFDVPAYQCTAFVDVTELDTGAPLTVCQENYPGTRLTFLAEITTPAGVMTSCLTAHVGA
ncbi:hypothetical protein [Streptomyces endophyticus]|uniref:CUB domain-containing protein n=1 Tax=Streptomyces endophyticus TaxID=714166 RepID=A0ABU6FBZ7_9ACTN|nr:hypothetical protein [Streptomyces endophyticus]MEB8340302.1 hypothetical protein [Streptomyces endophyticus]